MDFANNLKRLRAERGLTQEAVAQLVNVSIRNIQNWERGAREPRLAALKSLAEGLGVSVDVLLAEAKPAKKPAPKKAARVSE
jgi:XRE family transcriptional regulator, fatty acid utilization regulator